MKNYRFSQENQRQITTFLVLFRWTTLLFSLMIIFIQSRYRLTWHRETAFFLVLFVYNSFLTYVYEEILRKEKTAKWLTLVDTILSVFIVTMTGELQSPYFYYSLSSIFAHAFFYQIRGALEGLGTYILTFLISSIVMGGRSASFDSIGNIIIFMVQGALMAILSGFPSVLIHQLDLKSQMLEESRKNLLYLHEMSCMMNVGQTSQEIIPHMRKMSRSLLKNYQIEFYLLNDKEIESIGLQQDRENSSIRGRISDYIEEWEKGIHHPFLPAETGTLIPIFRNTRLDGVIFITGVQGIDLPDEDIMLFTVIANMISTYLENNRLVQKIKEALLIDERKRIARDMHDGLAQSLFFFSAEIQNCRKMLGKKDDRIIGDKLFQLQVKVSEGLKEVRSYISNLRNDTIPDQGILSILLKFLEGIQRDHAIKIEYHPKIEKELSPKVGENLFRIIQEGVNNIVKHAGADRVKLDLAIGDEISMVLEDNGRGFDLGAKDGGQMAQPKFGLKSMRERVESLGGRFQLHTGKGEGTRLYITIPNQKGGKPHHADQIAYC